MAPNVFFLSTLFLTSLSVAAPAPARHAAAIPPCYEIVITAGTLPTPTVSPLSPQTTAQIIASRISVVTPAPELRHRQLKSITYGPGGWSVDTLPTETVTNYYWDGETPYSWPAGEHPPWLPPNGGTIINTGRLTVTLGKRDDGEGREKRQLSPITYGPDGWGHSVLPVATESGWWGEGKTFTFAGQTFTLGGTGVLTITLGKPPRDLGVRTMGLDVEERQELSYNGGSTRGGEGAVTASERPTVTYTDVNGNVKTVTIVGTDSLSFTQPPL
ncbi:hypothetical protein ONS95_004892 [Cadophora gregata]|uniref:uncharacterized protein n=1 Tax=Cadophora gregata TaxID=51156 RepID=UPI0026DCC61B|nr:uncharacterized protein ONS95_004892 [Cadophora gregata]KAK0104606.1 hypothetical protein ONS95_004892 [Cadophora gregata]KAK0115307.1 hypothetical protein ONS96_013766 [Cadophora gregata f. sp. sojae]